MEQQTMRTQVFQDEWGASSREGYEPRPAYQPRKAVKRRESNPLKVLGSLLMVTAIFWATYLLTSGKGMAVLIVFPGPVHVCGLGALVSILGKFIR